MIFSTAALMHSGPAFAARSTFKTSAMLFWFSLSFPLCRFPDRGGPARWRVIFSSWCTIFDMKLKTIHANIWMCETGTVERRRREKHLGRSRGIMFRMIYGGIRALYVSPECKLLLVSFC